jgi:DNA-binding transcriptional MerR regulator
MLGLSTSQIMKNCLTKPQANIINVATSNIYWQEGFLDYTTSEVLRLFEINRNTFQDWLDRKLVRPSRQKSSKQGEPNIFSLRDLYMIYCFIHLKESGIDRETAKEISRLFTAVANEKVLKYDFLYLMKNRESGNWHNEVELEKIDWDKYESCITVNCKGIKKTVDTLVMKRGK